MCWGHRRRSDSDTVPYRRRKAVSAKLPHEWRQSSCCFRVCMQPPHVFQAGIASWEKSMGHIQSAAVHVRHMFFLFNLLVFSSSATTRTLPAIFLRTQDKRITDVRGWNVPPQPLPFSSSCAVTSLWQPLHSHSFVLFCFPEACLSLVRYVGT